MNSASSRAGRILIVGGGGFVGRHLAQLLAAKGERFGVLDICAMPPDYPAATWHRQDLEDSGQLNEIFGQYESVIYLASTSLPAVSNQDICREVDSHVRQTLRAAETAFRAGVRKIVYASSGGTVYGTGGDVPSAEKSPTLPISAYGASKLALENYLRILAATYAACVVSLRISNPYGIWQRAVRAQGFIAAATAAMKINHELTIWGDGKVVRDFVHADDVALAFEAAAAYGGPSVTLNIGSGVGCSLNDVVAVINRITSGKLRTAYEPGRPADVPVNVLDVRLAAQVLHWAPRVTLESGLRELLNFHGLARG